MITGGRPDVGVPRQHVVIVVGPALGDHVVHRVVIAQRAVHRPGIGPGLSGGELEPVRHN
jgi:hypothetical protein